ncbi:hypothetical protein [Yoonia sp.]|uniref:hypothetical protein n=1 Tax=Yoonia sp. TaxID=2212373 RepID=UPI0019FBBD1F|nr:hypothetical protein [Yoonia sp.]MBE0413469.1 hypothetical protein [Yoonia sp.]
MHFFSFLLNGLLISFVPVVRLLWDHPNRDLALSGLAGVIYAVFGAALILFALRPFLRRLRGKDQSLEAAHPILVDGSNVMHWGGAPNIFVLIDVLKDLKMQGYTPLVYFDANVGYKLFDRYANGRFMAQQLMLPHWQVNVVPSGTIADETLLEKGTKYGIKIVTNDRFLDWQNRFPRVNDHGFLIKGRWTQGAILWRFPQDLALPVAA